MRLPNGFGTVHRLSNPDRRRKPYRAAICAGEKDDGSLIYTTIGYYKSKKDGILALEEYHNYPTDKKDITLKELYGEWSDGKYKNISPETVRSYKTAWNHLSPLYNVKIKDIRIAHWQSIIDHSHLSWSGLHKIKTLSGLLSKYAVQNDIIHKNYAEFIKLPKKKKKQLDVFTDVEIQKLKDRSGNEWVQTVLILIYTGMRINELVTMTLFQIDIKNEVITTGSKTAAGQRVIPIHKTILPFINKTVNINGNYLIELNGSPLSADRYRKEYYYPALALAGVRKLTPHKCRHTFATLMADRGVDTVTIQALMGHTDYALTANVYTHIDVEKLKRGVQRL